MTNVTGVNSVSNFPGGFGKGVTIRGMNVLNSYSGNVFWVDSNGGSDNGNGTFSRPFATIDYAVGRCTADNADIIMVKAGHTEDIAAASGIDLDVAGISIVGLGNGRNRPTITYSATDSSMVIGADDVSVGGLFFDVTGIDAVVNAILVSAADFQFTGNEVLMADSGGQAVEFILTDASAERMVIEGNKILAPNAGANNAISLVGVTDGVTIRGNHINGDFADACIHNPTGNVLTNMVIEDNFLKNDQTGDHAIELVSACTGVISNNHMVTSLATAALDAGSCALDGNTWSDGGVVDIASVPFPAGAAGIGTTKLERYVTRSTLAAAGSTLTTGASPVTLFTVTGDILVWGCWAVVGDTAWTSTSDTGTIAIGVTGNTAVLQAAFTVGSGTAAANEVISNAAATFGEPLETSGVPVAVSGDGTDIIATIATNSLTAGTGDFYIVWSPVSEDADVLGAAV
jgi:hypothetical protein